MNEIMIDNIKREYILYKPKALEENSPLVVFLHWYTGYAQDIINFTEFNAIADKYNFGVVYPEGLKDKEGIKHWNSGLRISSVDDVSFIEILVNNLVKEHSFNSKNIFVTGISNGGFMCYTLANQLPQLFNAYAPVIGTMSLRDWNERTTHSPVPIFHICGLDDEVVPPYKENNEGGGWGGAPNVDVIMEYWANKAGCESPFTTKIGKESTIDYYVNGLNNIEVWCLKIKKHGHEYPRLEHGDDVDGGELIWKFFQKYIIK